MIQSYSDPSAAFPRLPDLTAVKARWRIRCSRCHHDPLLLPAGQLRPAGGASNCGPIQDQLVFHQRPSAPFLLSLPKPAARKTFRCNITFTQQSKRFSVLFLLLSDPHCRSFQNNRMYYLIRVPEKVFFAFIFFHLVLIVSFFVYVLNYYASTNPAAFGMLKN